MNYRTHILKMLEDDRNGTKPLYRNREWNRENRMNDKENKRNNWYKNGKETEKNYTSILFVPPTPGSGLLKELKNREEELNRNKRERIKIVEKGKVENGENANNKESIQERKMPGKVVTPV